MLERLHVLRVGDVGVEDEDPGVDVEDVAEVVEHAAEDVLGVLGGELADGVLEAHPHVGVARDEEHAGRLVGLALVAFGI